MKKTAMFILGAVALVGAAHAGFQPSATVVDVTTTPSGDVVIDETIVTVGQAGTMRDDTNVILQGKIVSQFGGDRYTFADDTGSIMVEIDDDTWRGQTITPDDTVKIYGEVDRGIFSTEIEVDRIEKM